jgi:CheY-like chemotaxis protein
VKDIDAVYNINHMNEIQTNSNNADILAGKKILLVEDDTFLASILRSRLTSRNVQLTVAKNGEEAIATLAGSSFDGVLLDVLLPGMSGFEVLQIIRNTPEIKDVPVTVISNYNQVKDREKAESMNAAFLVKALVNPDDILAQVEKMVAGK